MRDVEGILSEKLRRIRDEGTSLHLFNPTFLSPILKNPLKHLTKPYNNSYNNLNIKLYKEL